MDAPEKIDDAARNCWFFTKKTTIFRVAVFCVSVCLCIRVGCWGLLDTILNIKAIALLFKITRSDANALTIKFCVFPSDQVQVRRLRRAGILILTN